jgi:hypothetical protein
MLTAVHKAARGKKKVHNFSSAVRKMEMLFDQETLPMMNPGFVIYDPLMKTWDYHQSSAHKKTFKVQSFAGKVMSSVFWDSEGILLVAFLDRSATVSPELYVETLKLKQRFHRVRPNRKMNKVLHDNARRHTSLRTRKPIVTMKWTIFHTPYSPM